MQSRFKLSGKSISYHVLRLAVTVCLSAEFFLSLCNHSGSVNNADPNHGVIPAEAGPNEEAAQQFIADIVAGSR